MALRIGLLFAVCLLFAAPAFAHDEQTLDPHNATLGVTLELNELPQTRTSDAPKYRLRAVGLQPGIRVGIWTQEFGKDFRLITSGMRSDEQGNLVPATAKQKTVASAGMTVSPGSYVPGAAWTVAVVSEDHSVRAFKAIIPRPMIARNGSCQIQLELISLAGNRFVATGTGFTPGDEVVTELRYSGRATEKRKRIAPDGRLPLEVISHEPPGGDAAAAYKVKGSSCEVELKYKWGAPALARR